MEISVTYQSVDGVRETRQFKTLAGAQRYAARFVGETPEIGSHYAISGDGIGKISVAGADLADLFPSLNAPAGWTVVNYFDTTGQGFTLRVQRGNEVWGYYTDWDIAVSAAAKANEARP